MYTNGKARNSSSRSSPAVILCAHQVLLSVCSFIKGMTFMKIKT